MNLILELLAADNSPGGCEMVIRKPDRRYHSVYLAELLERSYWKRLWAVQELLTARRVDIYCGSYGNILPLSAFAEVLWTLSCHETILSQQLWGLFSKLYVPVVYTLCFNSLPHLLSLQNTDVTLSEALNCTLAHECQDPRDKIYGILGFLKPEHQNQIQVDYSVPKCTVYVEAVQHILNTTHTLDIICRSVQGCCSSRWPEPGFPSWLPDFSSMKKVRSVRLFSKDFNASKSRHALVSITLRQRELEMNSVPLGTSLTMFLVWTLSLSFIFLFFSFF